MSDPTSHDEAVVFYARDTLLAMQATAARLAAHTRLLTGPSA